MSAVISYVFHIFPGVVEQSPFRSRLLLFNGIPMPIIFLERLSSSLLLTCPHQFHIFCIRNVDILHTVASPCVTWFLAWCYQSWHPQFRYTQSVLVFLSSRPTLCSKCHCWFDHWGHVPHSTVMNGASKPSVFVPPCSQLMEEVYWQCFLAVATTLVENISHLKQPEHTHIC